MYQKSGYHHELTEIEEHSKDQMLQQCKEAIEELNLQLAGQQEIQQALMEEKNRQYDDMSEEIAVLKEECEHLREEVHRKSQDLLCMEQVNTDLQKRHQIMQEFSATFEQVNTRIQETVRERDQLAEENESYKAQVEELTQTVIEKDRELERVIGELENLRRSNENGGQLQQSQNSRQQQLQSQQRQQQQIQQLQQQQQNNQQQQPSSSLGVLDGQYNSLDRNPMTHQVESRHTPYDDAQNSHNISNHNENSSTFQEVKSASFREQTHPEVSMTNLDGNNHMEDATGTNNNRNRSRSGRSNRSNHTHNINSNRHESPMHYPQGKSSQINGGNSVIDASNQQGEMDSNISRQFERMETALILRSSELAQREQQYEEALRELHSREDILQAREERYEREQQRQVIFLEQQQQKQRRELEQQSMQQQHRSNEESKQLKEAMYELSMQQTALSSAQNTIEAQSKETRKLASSNEQLRQV